MKENLLLEKSYRFAIRIIRLCRYLNDVRHEFIVSKQVLYNGTSIGAQVEEAQQGLDRPDFLRQMSVAMKFAFKTNYWLRLLHDTDYIDDPQFESIIDDCIALQKMLSKSVKTTKANC